MPGHQQDGDSSTHERVVDEIMQQMETDGALSDAGKEWWDKGSEKIREGGKAMCDMGGRAYAALAFKGKERRTKELEVQGCTYDEIRKQLWKEHFITESEYRSGKGPPGESEHDSGQGPPGDGSVGAHW